MQGCNIIPTLLLRVHTIRGWSWWKLSLQSRVLIWGLITAPPCEASLPLVHPSLTHPSLTHPSLTHPFLTHPSPAGTSLPLTPSSTFLSQVSSVSCYSSVHVSLDMWGHSTLFDSIAEGERERLEKILGPTPTTNPVGPRQKTTIYIYTASCI